MQKQLEKRILEVEKMKQHEQEQKRKAVDAVEKQVSLLQTFYTSAHEKKWCCHILSFIWVPWLNCGKLSLCLISC